MSVRLVLGIEAIALAVLIVGYYLKEWLDSRSRVQAEAAATTIKR